MIDYLLDGVNIRTTYGVYVSSSTGIIGMPKRKSISTVSYADEDGSYVDASKVSYEDRNITLKCFLQGTSNATLLTKFNAFAAVVNAPGLHYLCVLMNNTPKLLFCVYNSDEIDVDKEWSNGAVVGTFTLKLVDPMPRKKCYQIDPSSIATSVQISVVGSGKVSIHWGDGNADENVAMSASGVSKTHTYASGTTLAYVAISGAVGGITQVTFNLIATEI